MVDCKICEEAGEKFVGESEKHLHNHLRYSHAITQEKYYQKYYPRYDLLSGVLISFKNKDSYFSTDFNEKESMRIWLESQPIEAQREYCLRLLQRRKEKKGLIYTPTQVELRTIMAPSIITLEKIFPDYYAACEQLGFKNKFKNFTNWNRGRLFDDTFIIYVDTREQKPLRFNAAKTESKKLDYGDYCFVDSGWTGNVYIERKSLHDFVGTLSSGFERFEREIQRASDAGAYLIVLVEELLSKAFMFNRYSDLPKFTKVTPEFIFRNVRDLIQKYPHVQFLFVDGREKAAKVIENLFQQGTIAKEIDLQRMYDKRFL